MADTNDISIAAALRRGREARGETLEQLHQQLGVSRKVLAGIEAGDFDVVEKIYVRLAIWHYAEHVGLGGDTMAERFEREIGLPQAAVPVHTDAATTVPITPSSPLGQFLQRQSLGRIVGVLLAILLLCAVGTALWSRDQDDDQVFDHAEDYLSSPLSQVEGTPPRTSTNGHDDSQSATDNGMETATDSAAATDSPTSDARSTAAQRLPAQAMDQPLARATAADTQLPPVPISTTANLTNIDTQAQPTTSPREDVTALKPHPSALPNPATSVPEQVTSIADRSPEEVVAVAATEVGGAQETTTVTVPVPVEGGAAPSLAAGADTIILEASAIDSTWVQVQWDGVNGIEEIIPKGETRRWQAQRFFMVRAGRAHGVRFSLQGDLLGEGHLGDATLVLRFRGQADGYQLLGPALEPLGPFTRLSTGEHDPESVTAERP